MSDTLCLICKESHAVGWLELAAPMPSPGNVTMTHYARCPKTPGLAMLRGFIVDRRIVKVASCARCGGDHEIEFTAFSKNAITGSDGEMFTHFALCPLLNEPILMRITNESDDPVAASAQPAATG